MKDNWDYIRSNIQYFRGPKIFNADNRLEFNFSIR